LFDFLSGIYKPHGFIHELEDFGEDPSEHLSGGLSEGRSGSLHEDPSGCPNEDLCEDPNKDASDGPYVNPNDGNKFIKKMRLTISNMTASQNILRKKYEKLTTEKHNALKKSGEMFMAVFQKSIGLEVRPSQILIPREGGSITPLQESVTNTRLGHGSQRKKTKITL